MCIPSWRKKPSHWHAGKVWKTDNDGNPAWRDESGAGFSVIDNLTSTSTTDALSANQGKVLNEKFPKIKTNMSISSISANSTQTLKQLGFYGSKGAFLIALQRDSALDGGSLYIFRDNGTTQTITPIYEGSNA